VNWIEMAQMDIFSNLGSEYPGFVRGIFKLELSVSHTP
jgi:hypothetical protein